MATTAGGRAPVMLALFFNSGSRKRENVASITLIFLMFKLYFQFIHVISCVMKCIYTEEKSIIEDTLGGQSYYFVTL